MTTPGTLRVSVTEPALHRNARRVPGTATTANPPGTLRASVTEPALHRDARRVPGTAI
jgi:hypothetical protein